VDASGALITKRTHAKRIRPGPRRDSNRNATMDYSNYFTQFPDEDGEFAGYGGAYLPPPLIPVFAEITAAY